MTPPPPASTKRLPVWRPTVGVLVLMFVLATASATWFVSNRISVVQEQRLELEASRVNELLEQRLAAYEQVLRGGLGLFAASDSVTLDEWIHYVKVLDLDARYPGFKSLVYCPRMPASAIESFIDSVRQGPETPSEHYDSTALADYTVWAPLGSGPPGEEVAPIQFVAPFTVENQKVLGLDPLRDPVRRDALYRSATTGTTVLTNRVLFLPTEGHLVRAGFVAYLPVDVDGEFRGWLGAAFVAQDFMDGLNAKVAPGIDIEVSDGLGNLLYSGETAPNGAPVPLVASAGPELTTTAAMGGRLWVIHYTTTDNFPARGVWVIPWIVATSGALLTLLVLIVSWTGAGWRHRAVRLQHSEAKVRHQATHDPLTGLSNRSLFLERLDAAICGPAFALAYIDVDGFKPINDDHGHRAGDALLVVIAQRLRSALTVDDHVARLGGDEFAMMIADPTDATHLTERVLELLREPFTLPEGDEVQLSVSIGVAHYDPDTCSSAEDLVHSADRAMLAAKRAGRDRVAFADTPG